MAGFSIEMIKIKISLLESRGYCGTLTYKALKELLEYKETGLTPQDIKEMDNMYLEKCQQVNKLTCTCEMYERMAKK